jgi:hypothetical protein
MRVWDSVGQGGAAMGGWSLCRAEGTQQEGCCLLQTWETL